jgi:hypothetical protein
MGSVPTRQPLLTLLAVVASLALPAAALAQSAGDEQYTDPFGQEDSPAPQQEPATQQPEPAPEQPAQEPSVAPQPDPGGNGSAEAAPATDASQGSSPVLPRTGVPVLLLAAAGYVLLVAGIAIRRKA